MFLFLILSVVCFWRDSPQLARASSFTRFLDHTQRRTTVGRTPLDEWSARRRDLYLTTHTTLTTEKRPCPSVGFEPIISAGERPQTYALDRAATGSGILSVWHFATTSSLALFGISIAPLIIIIISLTSHRNKANVIRRVDKIARKDY